MKSTATSIFVARTVYCLTTLGRIGDSGVNCELSPIPRWPRIGAGLDGPLGRQVTLEIGSSIRSVVRVAMSKDA